MPQRKRPDEAERRPDEASEAEQRPDEASEAEQRFIADLVIRGEVAPEGTGPLPPDATHEVEEEGDGVPRKVRRRRFSSH
jgi:hypothetical protein